MNDIRAVAMNLEKPVKFKKKKILKINPFHPDYKGARFRYRMSMVFSQIKFAFQRALYGYDNVELWNMDEIFISKYRRMLKNLLATSMSHPGELTEEQWKRVIGRMIELLEIMRTDEFDASEWTLEAAKRKNLAKDQFFRLFSRWFWDLWD